MVEDNTARDAQQVAQMEADVGREHIGRVYAEGFLAAAESARATDALLDAFDSLVADVLDAFPEFEQLLASSLVSHEDKAGVLDRVLGPRMPTLFLNFLKVVSRHDRLDCLRAIHKQAHALDDERRGRVPIRLTTPTPVSDALAEQIHENLRKLIGGEPILERETDPELIGGAVLRIGDTVYDGSIATQLENMRQQMIDRSVHEIQSRRDRFRNSTGN